MTRPPAAVRRRPIGSAPRSPGYSTKIARAATGASESSLTLWGRMDLLAPIEAHGHGHGGKVRRWSRRDIRRAYCLARIPGKMVDHYRMVDEMDRHHGGWLVALASKKTGESWVGVCAAWPKNMSAFLGYPEPPDLVVVTIDLGDLDRALDAAGVL